MLNIILLILISLTPAIIWCWFYIFSTKEKIIISYGSLILSFLIGSVIAGITILFWNFLDMNMAIFSGKILNIFSISQEQFQDSFFSYFIFFLISFFVAFIETGFQYFLLKLYIKKRTVINKTFLGVQLATFLGLGFIVVKNSFNLFQALAIGELGNLFVLQFLLSGLGYVLCVGVLGYSLAISKFHKLYTDYFSKNGFMITFFTYGFLNFYRLRQVFYYTGWILIVVFVILIKYLIERRNFEFNLTRREKVIPPFLYRKEEVIAFLFNEKISFYEMKRLHFCPTCFTIKESGWRTCPYCETKFL